jgi:hypothetical protein
MHLLKNNILINVLCQLQFVPLSAVADYSVAQDGFTKTVAASFFDVYGTPATMLFTQNEEKTPSGSRYQQQITLSYPGLQKANLPILHALDQDEFLVKFTDTAGQQFIMGSPDAGAQLAWQYSTSFGGFEISFFLTDSIPCGFPAELGQFFFDERGYLMSTYESSETFYFNADGQLIVDGPNQANYYLQNGLIYLNN